MRTMAVVMLDVGVEDALELATAGDQDPVEALAPYGADEALGKRVRLRSLDRCSDNPDALKGANSRVAVRRRLGSTRG